jgi:pimeloyl-ACP methyl ester carboxylesterase
VADADFGPCEASVSSPDAGKTPRLFVPGFAVRGSLYGPSLPPGWEALDPPRLSSTGGRFEAYRIRLRLEVESRGRPVVLAGHSMGAALAICVAADRPDLVERLVLFSPAGLPLSKPMSASFLLLASQALRGLYPLAEIAYVVGETIGHPWATYRLAREAHDLDLIAELTKVAAASIPALVVACTSDTLTTPAICAAVAERLAGGYREVTGDGHMWMLGDGASFRALLDAGERSPA